MSLFQAGNFVLHSGQHSSFLIDCTALTETDLDGLALLVAERWRWGSVCGIPEGGKPFAQALAKYTVPSTRLPRLVVDDVYTTGASLRGIKKPSDLCVVIFARTPPPSDIHAIFQMWMS